MKLTIQRAAHTANGFIFAGAATVAELVEVGADNSKGRNPYAVVRFPSGVLYYFRVNSGWGEKPVKSYQIEPASLALVQDLAREKKLKVVPKDAPPKVRRVGTKRPKTAPEQQVSFLGATSE